MRRNCFGVSSQPRRAALGRGSPENLRQATPPFLSGSARSDARGGEGYQRPERGLMAHQSDPGKRVAKGAKHRVEAPARRQRGNLLRLRPGKSLRKDLRGLSRANERAR